MNKIFLTNLIGLIGLIGLISPITTLAQSKKDSDTYINLVPILTNQPGETGISNFPPPSPTTNKQIAPGAKYDWGNIPQSSIERTAPGARFDWGNAPSAPTAQLPDPNLPSCGPVGNGYRLCVPILGVTFIENSIITYIQLIYRFAFGIAGLVVFIAIVWGGIQYTISGGNPSLATDARDRIFQAIIGLMLLALSYIILNTINPALVRLKEPGSDVYPTIPPPRAS